MRERLSLFPGHWSICSGLCWLQVGRVSGPCCFFSRIIAYSFACCPILSGAYCTGRSLCQTWLERAHLKSCFPFEPRLVSAVEWHPGSWEACGSLGPGPQSSRVRCYIKAFLQGRVCEDDFWDEFFGLASYIHLCPYLRLWTDASCCLIFIINSKYDNYDYKDIFAVDAWWVCGGEGDDE